MILPAKFCFQQYIFCATRVKSGRRVVHCDKLKCTQMRSVRRHQNQFTHTRLCNATTAYSQQRPTRLSGIAMWRRPFALALDTICHRVRPSLWDGTTFSRVIDSSLEIETLSTSAACCATSHSSGVAVIIVDATCDAIRDAR